MLYLFGSLRAEPRAGRARGATRIRRTLWVILYYRGLAAGFFTTGAWPQDSLLLGSDRRILYYWGLTEGFYKLQSPPLARHPLVSVQIYIYIYYVNTYIYIYICIHVYIYIYIHMYMYCLPFFQSESPAEGSCRARVMDVIGEDSSILLCITYIILYYYYYLC